MKEKKHRKRKILPVLLGTVGILALAGLIVVFGFRVRSVEVEGNEYYSDNSIISWINNDDLAVNSLYILIRYNLTSPEMPTAVERMEISLKNPWTVHVQVREKQMVGYVDYDDSYLYFDHEGTALDRRKKIVEGVPHVEGLAFDASGVVLGETLPVDDESIFERITEVSRGLEKYKLTPDRLSCADGEIILTFGRIQILLGNDNYDERLAQIDPILEKLDENYPDTSGTLHLENFDGTSENIPFVPDNNE